MTQREIKSYDFLGEKVCPHCGARFKPTNPRQVYCKPQHKFNAKEKRRRQKRSLRKRSNWVCWTPWKLAFPTEKAANEYILRRMLYDLEPYTTCPCGSVHMRHASKNQRGKH